MIPKTIHFAWHDADLPSWAADNIERFKALNPGYQVMVHGPDVLLERYEPMCSQVARRDNQSDFWRYSALQRYGGWWFDVDYFPLRSIDEIAKAYSLDGSTFFVTEQHHQKNSHLLTAAGCLAATSDSPVWPLINDRLDALEPPLTGNKFGPELLTGLVLARPELFTVGRWPWFYPLGIDAAKRAYHDITGGGRPRDVLAVPMRLTGDQLPFAMHLWAGGRDVIPCPVIKAALPPDFGGLRVGLIVHNDQWKDRTLPFRAVADGLAALGCRLDVVVPLQEWPLFSSKPDVVVMWNGRHANHRAIRAGMRADGTPGLFMELGFFDRRAHTQIDHEGFNHTASWARDWPDKALPGAAARMRRVWPDKLVNVAPRDGYVLVLGQVLHDTQMQESETGDSWELYQTVKASTDQRVVYRKHPGDRRACSDDPNCLTGGTLAEHVSQASFVVCINSNAGNEALALGCRVLCLGPALYEMAGVARHATLATMPQAIDDMISGWTPDPVAVRRYLYHLIDRQWSQAELAKGEVLAPLLTEALK